MKPFERHVPDGTPWIDYQEAEKTGANLVFMFRIENFLQFILHEICVTYPCVALGFANLPLLVTLELSSTQNLFMPKRMRPQLFSSPSENFLLGNLNELPQGQRLQTLTYNLPCEKGENIMVTVSGVPTLLKVGCMITGKKYGGQQWE
jgi:hypothetical protein